MSLDIWLEIDVDTGGESPETVELFSANITHNLIPMWRAAGVYATLYESDGKVAAGAWRVLAAGVEYMQTHSDECAALDSPNGWGTYENALPWLIRVAEAFRKHPKARIRVSR